MKFRSLQISATFLAGSILILAVAALLMFTFYSSHQTRVFMKVGAARSCCRSFRSR